MNSLGECIVSEVFSQTLIQMVRIFALILLGYFFGKKKILPDTSASVISQLITKLLLPMLTLYTFMINCSVEALKQNYSLILYGAVFLGLAIALGYLLCDKLAGEKQAFANVLRYAIAIPNTGAFLTPIVLAFYGTEGYFFMSLCLFSMTIMCYSWGIVQLIPTNNRDGSSSKEKRAELIKRIFNPTVAAMLIGMILGLCGAKQWMPQMITDTVKGLGDCYTLMALIVIGLNIADYSLRDMLPDKTTFWFIGIRMLFMPIAFLLLMKVLHAPYFACFFAAAAYACPCGMNAIVYPLAYGQDCKYACTLVLASSMVSILTIPLIYTAAGFLL